MLASGIYEVPQDSAGPCQSPPAIPSVQYTVLSPLPSLVDIQDLPRMYLPKTPPSSIEQILVEHEQERGFVRSHQWYWTHVRVRGHHHGGIQPGHLAGSHQSRPTTPGELSRQEQINSDESSQIHTRRKTLRIFSKN